MVSVHIFRTHIEVAEKQRFFAAGTIYDWSGEYDETNEKRRTFRRTTLYCLLSKKKQIVNTARHDI